MITNCKNRIKINEIFQSLSRTKARAFLSVSGMKDKIPINFSAQNEGDYVLAFAIKEETRNLLESRLYAEDPVKLLVKSKSVLFESEFLEFDRKKILIRYPERISFFNRREKERIMPYEKLIVVFNYHEKKFERPCLDISTGGLSMFFSKQTMFKFKRDESIKILLPQIRRDMVLKAKVTQVAPLKPGQVYHHPYGGIRVSIKFLKISKENLKSLLKYIEDEAISRELGFGDAG